VWKGKLTGHILGDRGQLRGRARLCWEVVGVEPEELFFSHCNNPILKGLVMQQVTTYLREDFVLSL